VGPINSKDFENAVKEVENLLIQHGESNARHFLLSVTVDKAVEKEKAVNKNTSGWFANGARFFGCASGDPKGSPTVSRTMSPVPGKDDSYPVEYVDHLDHSSDEERPSQGHSKVEGVEKPADLRDEGGGFFPGQIMSFYS